MKEVKELLEEARQKQVEVVNRINEAKQQEQQLLQEALRLEGEIRLLSRLADNGDGSTQVASESLKKGA